MPGSNRAAIDCSGLLPFACHRRVGTGSTIAARRSPRWNMRSLARLQPCDFEKRRFDVRKRRLLDQRPVFHSLGKGEVESSILSGSTIFRQSWLQSWLQALRAKPLILLRYIDSEQEPWFRVPTPNGGDGWN